MAARTFGGREPAVLHVREPGAAAPRVIALEQDELLLGREASCDLVLGPPTVSRRHARLRRRGESYTLEDLGSTAGTWLNGLRLAGSSVVLQEGDRILIGPCELVFQGEGSSSSMETTILDERDVSETAERQRAEIRAEAKLHALLEVARELARTQDPAGMLDRILASLLRVFPRAERGLVLMREAPGLGPVIRACRERGGGSTRPVRRFSRTVIEHVLDRGKAVLCADIADDSRFVLSRSVDELPYRTMMGVPLRDHLGQPVGLLQLDTHADEGAFTADDLELLIAVSGPIGVSVDNARLLEDAQRAREEAVAASRAKDRFLAVLSHELRTPLTPALIAVAALLDDEDDPTRRPALEMIRRNIEIEARLIDDLLDLTRISRGRLSLERRRLDAHDVVRQALEVCRDAIDEAGLHLEFCPEADVSDIDGDPTRLQQILWNLIHNAVKFTQAGGSVVVRTRNVAPADADARARLILEVRDTGAGIAADALSRIFDPFEQSEPSEDPARYRTRGLGLGLAIGRSLAEAHGGSLTARSPGPGRGSTFTLELPVADDATTPYPPGRRHTDETQDFTPLPASASRVTAVVKAPATPLPPLSILLIEDNRDTLRSLAMVLRSRGHVVAEAENLATARAILATEDIDLFVSDIELPDGSGLELMRELSAVAPAEVAGPPGIAMSGFGSDEDLRLSLEAGFALHLTKPIVASQLEDAIRQTLAAQRAD